MYLYDERQNLANYAQHNLSNITWAIVKQLWLTTLETNVDSLYCYIYYVLDIVRCCCLLLH